MRVTNKDQQCIGYRLNLLGVRAYRDHCQLVARVGEEWVPIGSPRSLPVEVPEDIAIAGDDALVITAYQYDQERPGSDLKDVLARRKGFDAAFIWGKAFIFSKTGRCGFQRRSVKKLYKRQ